MTRILWADDQPDVIKTLTSLLSPLDPKIIQVKSGVEALSKLLKSHFDLLILDLMMPPDKWGGLWLLEEMREAGVRVPALVLSGEGTQSETIAALRLGAKDYVTKDTVQSELLQRVCSLLIDSARDLDNHVVTSFPTPIALPYKRYVTTISPVSKLRRLIEFYESSLRLCTIIGISQLWMARGAEVSSVAWASRLLRGPSMGAWNQVRAAVGKELERDASFFQIHDAFDNKVVDSVIRTRNDISHGAEPSEARAGQLLADWQGPLQGFLDTLRSRLTLEIFFPLSLSYDGTQFEIHGRHLVGDSITLPSGTVKAALPPICNQPYLVSPSTRDTQWVSLFPFLYVEPAIEPNAWRILVFDGLRMPRNLEALSGEEPIHYIDIWSGQRDVVPAGRARSAVLPSFLVHRIRS